MSTETRKERERAQHRREVLVAAESVFAEKGFHNATVQEIADRAEFAVGSLYNLFESKEALYAELLVMRVGEYTESMERALEEAGGPVGKVRAAVRTKAVFFRDNRPLFRIFRAVMAADEPGSMQTPPRACVEMFERYLDDLERACRQGIESGLFRAGDPRLMAVVVDAAGRAVIEHWVLMQSEEDEMMAMEQVEDLLLRGLLREEGAE